MLRQESRLNPSVFRSLSEEEEEEGIRASKHNMGPRGTEGKEGSTHASR